jgi:hypothetical protein
MIAIAIAINYIFNEYCDRESDVQQNKISFQLGLIAGLSESICSPSPSLEGRY